MKRLMRSLAFNLTKKRIDENKLDVKRISVKSHTVSYFNLSSNAIVSFIYEGRQYYFRECPRRGSKKTFFVNAMNSFFGALNKPFISKEHFKQELPLRLEYTEAELSAFRAYIDKKRQDKGFWQLLAAADNASEKCGFSIWDKDASANDFLAALGFDDAGEDIKPIAIYFLWYMRGAAATYRTLNVARGKRYSFFNGVRSVSTWIIADALGLGHMITRAEWCFLEIEDQKTLFGVLSDAAPGVRMADMEAVLDGTLQKELTSLNVLDVICYQPDHGPNNYSISPSGTVCAFDNDNPRTLFPAVSVTGSLAGCSPLVGEDGKVARPYMDKALAERLKGLNSAALGKELKPYLNLLQIWALKRRIKKLVNAIKNTEFKGLLLEKDGWSMGTAKEEINGNYGTTYLTKAVNR